LKLNERNIAMSYFINPVKGDQCVFITCEGELSIIEVMSVQCEANALLASSQWNQIVVDITGLKSTSAAHELLELARGLSADFLEIVRIALVVLPGQIKRAKAIENIARNEGLFLMTFLEVEEARSWLKGINLRERSKLEPEPSLKIL
jgi:hypothetical protein